MATQSVTKTAIPHNATGLNLTDATFQTMTTGSGNGSIWTHSDDDIVVLKNDTGGTATFTLKLSSTAKTPATNYGSTVADPTVSVADGKTKLIRMDSSSFRDASGNATVECNVAGKIIVLSPG